MILTLRQLCAAERRIISSVYTHHQTVRRIYCNLAARDSEYKLLDSQGVVNNVYYPKSMMRNEYDFMTVFQRSFIKDARLHCKTGNQELGTTKGSDQNQTEADREVVSTEDQNKEVGRPKLEYKCIYFFPPINILRIVQRFQLLLYSTLFPAAVAHICTVPAPSYMMVGFVAANTLLMPLVFYMMPRMIGSMFVGGVGDVVDTLQVSRLSLFGNRKDSFYKIENIKPLSEVTHVNLVYSRFELYNKKEKLYLFHSFSKIYDKELYEIIFGRMK